MRNPELIALLGSMRTAEDLKDNFIPQLAQLDENSDVVNATLNTSVMLAGFGDSHRGDKEREYVSRLLRTVPEEDLCEFGHASDYEIEARKGFALLDIAADKILNQREKAAVQLRQWQLIRMRAIDEMERRSRANMLAEGGKEHLDSYISRVIYGPKPQTNDKKQNFFKCRITSGKIVAVNTVQFAVPEIYYGWVFERLVAGPWKGKTNSYSYHSHHLPAALEQEAAKIVYFLGFKPRNVVEVHYKWEDCSWKEGYRFTYSRNMASSGLTPLD